MVWHGGVSRARTTEIVSSCDIALSYRDARMDRSLELSTITHDLFELAQKFNSFYHKYPILNEKDDAERQRRAVCAEVFRRTMVAALALLGIPVPERM